MLSYTSKKRKCVSYNSNSGIFTLITWVRNLRKENSSKISPQQLYQSENVVLKLLSTSLPIYA